MLKIPKKWRELPTKEKMELPTTYFGFKREEIEKIRLIKDRKKKIFESARLQINKYGDIHSFLTSWIAGYSSDRTPRHVFGSMRKLRGAFIKSPQISKFKNIKFSWADLQRRINIPNKITLELAEETGIHIGDGNLYIRKDKEGYLNYGYSIAGDLVNESIYHKEHIANLMKKIYNIDARFIERKNRNSIESQYRSKAIVEFKNKMLGLPAGHKRNISIPNEILVNNNFSKRCVVGIFDTDFNITSSLAISGKMHSLRAAEQVHGILGKNKIKHIYRRYRDYARFYIRKEFALKIVKKWQMHNPKHLTKFEVFEKFGKFIPFTTTDERISLLKNKISVIELEKLSKKRALRKRPISQYYRIPTPRGLEPRTS